MRLMPSNEIPVLQKGAYTVIYDGLEGALTLLFLGICQL